MEIRTNIEIPESVSYIISVLNKNGYEAFAVGGCVRDSVLGKKPKDWDITTSANPLRVKELFEKTVDTGIKHGTVTVVLEGENYEVTTYRIEGEYTDNRRPDSVEFTTSLEEDLSRRDFTVNSIAYHPEKGFVDPFGGVDDLRGKKIRAVRNAGERFREDALRMMRAIRFSAQLDFELVEDTFEAIIDNASLIKKVSAERIRDELTKTLISEHPMKFILFREADLLRYILPEVDVCFDTAQNHPYHVYNVGIHTLHAVANIPNDRVLRWVMLLHDTGKPVTKTTDEEGIDHFYGHPHHSERIAEQVLNRLKFDNKTLRKICALIRHHDRNIEPSYRSVRKAVSSVGEDIFCNLLKVQEADKRSQNPEKLQPRLEKLGEIKRIYSDIVSNHHCLNLKDLAFSGEDLISMGFKPGKEIGQLLNALLEAVIENPELNSKEKLREVAKNISLSNLD
ncbi:MAG: HD domain-containing protein [Clostridia bacterium]|nr:HD domain-containing protein [Clostridia bacterium]